MKKNNGITMIALIITIIVMLILATVTLNFVTDGGIIAKAKEAINKYQLHILRDELNTYHGKRELKRKDGEYDPKGLYAFYDKIVYLPDEYTAEIDDNKNIYDILESLKDSRLDGNVWIKEGEIVFEEPDYTTSEKLGVLRIAADPKPEEQKVDAVILYDAKLIEGYELQCKLNDNPYETFAEYSPDAQPLTVTIPVTKEMISDPLNAGKITVYARIFDTINNQVYTEKEFDLTIPTIPTDIYITPTENTLTVIAKGSKDSNGLGIKGYMYSIDGGITWTDIIEERTPYIFSELLSNQTKTIIAKAVNNVGFESEIYSKQAITKALATVSIGTNDDLIQWTKNDITLYVEYNGGKSEVPDGYELQYKKGKIKNDNIEWNNFWETYDDEQKVLVRNNNTAVQARVVSISNENDAVQSEICEVTNIDKERPTVPTEDSIIPTTNSLTVNAVGSIDTLSGLDGYKYSINNGNTWTDILKEGVSYTYEGLDPGEQRHLLIRAVDNVGWESQNYEKNISTLPLYTIEYNSNADDEVTNIPQSQTKEYNKPITLSTNIPVREGYDFFGWSADYLSNNPEYLKADVEKGIDYTSNESIVLYAIWKPNQYTITLDNANAEELGTATLYEIYSTGIYHQVDPTIDREITKNANPITTPKRTGYDFDGYYINQNGAGLKLIDENGYLTDDFKNRSFASNATIHANWIPKKYQVDLNLYVNGSIAVNGSGVEDGYGERIKVNLTVGNETIENIFDYYETVDFGSKVKVTGLKIDDFTIPYETEEQTVGTSGLQVRIDFNTVQFAINNSNAGEINTNNIVVLTGTSYTVNERTITFSDNRIVNTELKQLDGFNTNFVNWTDQSGNQISTGTISTATTITANYSRTENTVTIYYYPNEGRTKDSAKLLNNDIEWQTIDENAYAYAKQVIHYTDVGADNKDIWNVEDLFEREGYHIDAETENNYAWLINSPNSDTTFSQGATNFKEMIANDSTVINLYANWKISQYKLDFTIRVNGTPARDSNGYDDGYGGRIKFNAIINNEEIGYDKDYCRYIDYGSTWNIIGVSIDNSVFLDYSLEGVLGAENSNVFIDFYTVDCIVNDATLGSINFGEDANTPKIVLKDTSFEVSESSIIFNDGTSVEAVPKTDIAGYNVSFINWTDSSNNVLSNGTINSSITFRANLSKAHKSVTVKFYRNFTTNDEVFETAVYEYFDDDNITPLPEFPNTSYSATGYRAGYTLSCWGLERDGGTTYNLNSNVHNYWIDTNSPEINLYAQWTENFVTLNYYPNGGTVKDSAKSNYINAGNFAREWQNVVGDDYTNAYAKQIIYYNDSMSDNRDIWNVTSLFEKTGYHINEETPENYAWKKGSADSNETLTQGTTNFKEMMVNGSITINLYANWKSNTVTLYYYPNAEDTEITRNTVNCSTSEYISSGEFEGAYKVQEIKYSDADSNNKNIWNVTSLFSRNGYYIATETENDYAWIKDTPDSGDTLTQEYTNFRNMMQNGSISIKLYANWKAKPVYVYYNANGGTVTGGQLKSNSTTEERFTADSNGNILDGAKSNIKMKTEVNPGAKTDLCDYNNYRNNDGKKGFINVVKNGYVGKAGEEWKNSSGTVTFNHRSGDTTYDSLVAIAEDKTDHYEVTLYVNWVTKPVYVYYKTGGGTVTGGQLYEGRERFSTDSEGFVLDECDLNNIHRLKSSAITIGNSVDLINYNNARTSDNNLSGENHTDGFLNIVKTGYIVPAGQEWKAVNGNQTFNHNGEVNSYDSLIEPADDKGQYYELVLEPNWKPKVLTVVFWRNSSLSDTEKEEQTFTYDVANQSFSDKGWTISGKSLLYWSGNRNGNKPSYDSNHSIYANVTNAWINNMYDRSPTYDLYAQWTDDKFVNYNKNTDDNVSGLPDSQKIENNKFTVNSGVPTRIGYNFVGWYANTGGTGTKYETGQEYTANTSITLYAKWSVKSYGFNANICVDKTISNDGYGGRIKFKYKINNGAESDWVVGYHQNLDYGTNFKITQVKIGETAINYSREITVDETNSGINVHFFIVTFESNNTSYGTASSTSVIVLANTNYSVEGDTLTFSRSGCNESRTVTATPKAQTAQYTYAFSNWSSTSGTITESTTITVNFTMTVRKYYLDLKIYLDNGSTAVKNDNLKVGIKVGGTDKGYLNDYYKAHNYGTSYEAYGVRINGVNYTFKNEQKITGTVTSEKTIRVDFETLTLAVNDSTRGKTYGNVSETTSYVLKDSKLFASGATVTAIHDRVDIVAARAEAINKTGYWTNFENWKSGNTVIGNKNITVSAASTITANFNETVKSVTVKFMRNHTSDDTEKKEATYTYQLPDKSQSFNASWADWNNNTQDRWYLNQACTSDVSYSKNSTVSNQWIINNAGQTVTLYAKWVPKTYTITYYNGSTKLGTSSGIYGTSTYLRTISYLGGSQSGYSFYGWTTSTNSTTRDYTDGQNVTDLGNISLYAIWVSSTDGNKVHFYSGSNKETETKVDQYYNPKAGVYSVTTPAISNLSGSYITWIAKGWRDDTTAGAKEKNASTVITSNTKMTNFYAVYESVSIEFYSGRDTSGKSSQSTKTFKYNSYNTFDGNFPEPTAISGWTTLGWRVDTTPTTKNNEKTAKVTSLNIRGKYYAVYSKEITCYAGNPKSEVKVNNKKPVKYYNAGNSTNVGTVGGSLPSPTSIANWNISGWRDDTDAKLREYDNNATPAFDRDTYYATYYRVLYVKFNGNGNTGGNVANLQYTQFYNANDTISSHEFSLPKNNFTRTGYLPKSNKEWREGSKTGTERAVGYKKSFSPELTNTSTTLTFYANWEAQDVSYKIEHYLMKVDGNYPNTPNEKETKQAKADSVIIPNSKSFTNSTIYSNTTEQPVTIKADGSTVVKYYYPRRRYSYKLNTASYVTTTGSTPSCKDGETIIAGTTIQLKAQPYDGYEFDEWKSSSSSVGPQDKENANTSFNLIGNVTITPSVKPKQYKLTVIAGGSDNDTSVNGDYNKDGIGKRAKLILPGGTKGYEFNTNFTYKERHLFACSRWYPTNSNGTSCVIGEYSYAVNNYFIPYRYGYRLSGWSVKIGNTVLSDSVVNNMISVEEKDDPDRNGFKYYDYYFSGIVTSDVTIEAKWTLLPLITVDANGGRLCYFVEIDGKLDWRGEDGDQRFYYVPYYPENTNNQIFAATAKASSTGYNDNLEIENIGFAQIYSKKDGKIKVPRNIDDNSLNFSGWKVTKNTDGTELKNAIFFNSDATDTWYYYKNGNNGDITIQAQWY